MNETEKTAAKTKYAAGSVAAAAKEAIGDVADPLKQKASEMAEQAKEMAEPLTEKALEMAKEQKDAGADQLRLLARAMRCASDGVRDDVPRLADYVRSLSSKLDEVSDDIRESDLDEIGQTVSDFAKRNPALVFGGAMIAGLALSRVLKSSARHADKAIGKATGAYGTSQAGNGARMGNGSGSYAESTHPSSDSASSQASDHSPACGVS